MKPKHIRFIMYAVVAVAIGASAGLLAGKAALGHEVKQPEIPTPPATAGVLECFETHKDAVIDQRYRSDREFNYNNVLKVCVLNADKDHQFKEAIMLLMQRVGLKVQ